MTSFFTSIGLTVVFVLFLTLIRNVKGELVMPFSVCVSVCLAGISLAIIAPLIEYINSIVTHDSEEYFIILLKSVGVSLTAAFAADICRDAGEQAIASKVELLGKCEILVLSLPLFKKITELLFSTLEGL